VTVPTRVALYYAPHQNDPLWNRAAGWLGRDPVRAESVQQPDLPGIAEITADARSYGFHATLKPPMRLAPGANWRDVVRAAEQVAASVPAFELPPLAVREIHGFLALRETAPSPTLQALADVCTAGLDHLRADADGAEITRRRGNGLSPAAEANLLRWGYPWVFATWFFHMTVTRRLNAEELPVWRAAAGAHFAGTLGPRLVTDICLFTEPAAGAPFTLALRIPLRG
jgi:hypothetical protein